MLQLLLLRIVPFCARSSFLRYLHSLFLSTCSYSFHCLQSVLALPLSNNESEQQQTKNVLFQSSFSFFIRFFLHPSLFRCRSPINCSSLLCFGFCISIRIHRSFGCHSIVFNEQKKIYLSLLNSFQEHCFLLHFQIVFLYFVIILFPFCLILLGRRMLSSSSSSSSTMLLLCRFSRSFRIVLR